MADPDLPRGQRRRRPGADPDPQPRGPLRRRARPLARASTSRSMPPPSPPRCWRPSAPPTTSSTTSRCARCGRASRSPLGPFTIEAINVAHSIPESCALLITTAGRAGCVHTGDWKLDPHPDRAPRPPTPAASRRSAANRRPPLALICDSTNALKDGESPSEDEVARDARRADRRGAAPRRAHDLRLQRRPRHLDRARRRDRPGARSCMSGRALHRITGIARELGMLEGIAPFLDQDAYKNLPRNKVVPALHRQPGRAARRDRPHRARASIRRSISTPATA